MICKKVFAGFIFMLLSALTAQSVNAFSANDVIGDATEGMMKDYFTASGWKATEGQIGRQGIDGLFLKYDRSGAIKDVLIAESKYNTSKLGKNLKCGNRQMSQDWVICKLDDLIKKAEREGRPVVRKKYAQIKRHVQEGNYRALKWNSKVVGGKLLIEVEKIKSKGDDVQIKKLFGGEKYKFQYKRNQAIDLRNPENAFQRKMSQRFYANLGQSLNKTRLPTAEQNRILNEFKKHPERIRLKLDSLQKEITGAAQLRIPTRKNPVVRKVSATPVYHTTANTVTRRATSQINKRAAKSFSKRLLKNLDEGVKGAAVGSFAGPWGVAIGFCAGLAGGMVMDYVIDSAVDEAFGADSPPSGTGFSETDFRRELEQSAVSVRQDILAVQTRMEREFEILGNDMQNYHKAELAAIQTNFLETLKVGRAVDKVGRKVEQLSSGVSRLNANLVSGFQSLRGQFVQISAALESISTKLDGVYKMLDARIKADFDSGIESVELFEKTGDMRHLSNAIEYFRTFKNTLIRIENRSLEQDYMIGLSRYFISVGYFDLFQTTQNQGYAKSAVDAFRIMMETIPEDSELADLLPVTYLSIQDADLHKEAGKLLTDLYLPEIRQKLKEGKLDLAEEQAQGLSFWVKSEESTKINNAMLELVDSGSDRTGLFDDLGKDYRVIKAFIKNTRPPQGAGKVSSYISNIISGQASPADFKSLLERYQSAELTRFAVRKLIKAHDHGAALDILANYSVNDDNFRVKACLLIYDTLDSSKAVKLKNLVLSDPTYSSEVKAFAEKI